jgi:hypothetical protein
MFDNYSYYSRVYDVICNRQARFVEKLREARSMVEQCHLTMLCFKTDLERRKVTTKEVAIQHISDAMNAVVLILGELIILF